MPTFQKVLLLGLTCFSLSAAQSHAQSQDLLSLYQRATEYDASIAAAREAYLAEAQGEDIAFASLLPAVSGSASVGDTNANSNLQIDQNYKTQRYAVSLSQPLLDFGSWFDYSAAEQQALRAKTEYLNSEQDLILNVAQAYFGVLRAEEDLIAAIALETAVKRQYEQAKEQFDVGLIAITDVHEAKASYDDSKTVRIRSEGNLVLSTEQLSLLTGEYATDLKTLAKDYPVAIDENANSEAWVESANENNLQIKIATYAMAALKEQHRSSKAGHYPTLSLSASYENTELNDFSPADSETEDSSIFLNLNVPIYTGGATSAGTRQTRHLLEQARQQLVFAQRQARIDARTQYVNLTTNAQTVESLAQNIVSRESALEATREGYKVGTRNIVEVLDAERNYFTALRDYANARFDFVESSLALKKAAGTLSAQDIEELNQWLADSP